MAKRRAVRIEEKLWKSFDDYCKSIGSNRSVEINKFIQEKVREFKLSEKDIEEIKENLFCEVSSYQELYKFVYDKLFGHIDDIGQDFSMRCKGIVDCMMQKWFSNISLEEYIEENGSFGVRYI